MKLDDLKGKVPPLKPRNSTHHVLRNKANAGGAHRDKKAELKKGVLKHKGRGVYVKESIVKLPDEKQVFEWVKTGHWSFSQFQKWVEDRDERQQQQSDWAARDAAGH